MPVEVRGSSSGRQSESERTGASVPLQAARLEEAFVAPGSARSSSSVFQARHSEHWPFHFGC